MSETYYARYKTDTTEVEADDYSEAREQAADEFGVMERHIHDLEQMDDDEFHEFHEDVHIRVDADAEWTCEVTITTTERNEYDREVISEFELVDEFGLHGAVVDVQHGQMELDNVAVDVRGFTHEGEEGACVYVEQSVSEFY